MKVLHKESSAVILPKTNMTVGCPFYDNMLVYKITLI